MKVGLDMRSLPPIILVQPQSDTEAKALRAAGATWIKQFRVYGTTHLDLVERVAARLRADIPPELLDRLKSVYEKLTYWSDAPDDSRLRQDLALQLSDLYPYQRVGAASLIGRQSVLLADDMGLGKTAQVAVAIRSIYKPGMQFLVVCPASLKLWWAEEIEKWSGIDSISVLQGASCMGRFKDSAIVILNYDILQRHEEFLNSIEWEAVILDEAHAVKSSKANRTKIICGLGKHKGLHSKRRWALTGTPILNRPDEMFQVLRWLDPVGWPNVRVFQTRYCDARIDRFGFWNTKGASNLDELNLRLRRTVMIRRRKVDVLDTLPAKTRQVLYVDPDTKSATVVANQAGWMQQLGISASEDGTLEKLTAPGAPFEEISRMRQELAASKVEVVVDYLRDILIEKQKIVVFAHHLVLLDGIYEAFRSRAVLLTGETSTENRAKAVERFQTDPDVHLFVGSIKAAGFGITLTAADLAVFAEMDWVPGNVLQAEDRLHRIGQKSNVLVQYLVVNDSLDARVIQALVGKIHVIEQTLGKEIV